MSFASVIGPPGTGKTYYLERQAKRAAEKFGASNVGACSFTKAAAEELVSRLPTPDHLVGTLHSLAYRAIGDVQITEESEIIEEWNEQYPNYRRDTSFNMQSTISSPETGDDGDALMMDYQELRAKQGDITEANPKLRDFADSWEEFKNKRELYDFTDLIEHALNEIPKAPGDPKVLLIDEAQDLTKLEMQLAKKWATQADWGIFVGDPAQCLYEFKGCDPKDYLEIIEESDEVTIRDQSYRVPKKIQEFSEEWLTRLQQERPDEYIEREYESRDEEGHVEKIGADYKNPIELLDRIEEKDGTHMILTSCGYMLDNVKGLLRKRGIPFHNPMNRSRGDWNPLRGGENSTSSKVKDYFAVANGKEFWSMKQFKNWISLIKSGDVLVHGAKSMLEMWESDGKQPVNQDMDSVFEDDDYLWKAYEGDVDFLRENLLKSKRSPAEYALRIVERQGVEALCEEPDIIIGTIHSVKGGQADHVYVFPDLSSSAMEKWNNGEKASIIRQFYVGFTRARKSLYIGQPAGQQSITI